jgi:S1-C subfamily serine protease
MKRFLNLSVVMALALAMLACSVGPTLIATSIPNLPTVASMPAPVLNTPAPRNPAPTSAAGVISSPAAVLPDLSPVQLDAILPDLYAKVSPGVVAILTIADQGGGLGSGFVFDTNGNIVTNFHVVDGATDLEVDFQSGLKARATVVATDLDSDLAVIRVNVPAAELKPLTLGDSDKVRVGQQVVALGNPFGLTGTMTLGIVSAKGRTLDSLRPSQSGTFFSSGDIIQTDASINPGNSGGPLINLQGQVIGINRAIRTTGTSATGDPVNSGIGFTVPINIVKRVVPVLISTGKYDYPYLGITFHSSMSLSDYELIGLKQTSGAYVVDVTPGGPGDQAGIRPGKTRTGVSGLTSGGDLIIGVDGRPVLEFGDLIGYVLENKNPGDKITVTLIRDNAQKEVVITLGKRP